VLNEFVDASDQFADAAETSAADGLLSDEAKPGPEKEHVLPV